MLNDLYQKLTNIWFVFFLIIFMCAGFIIASYFLVNSSNNNIYTLESENIDTITQPFDVAVVFGGGIDEDGPRPLLKDRLDTAKSLLDKKYIDRILLSGDNRTASYNEPQTMYEYLISAGVSPEYLVVDFAGRSTYETCERSVKIFGLERAILISEQTHLPRARYLCRHFGLETMGIASEGIATAGKQIGQTWREFLARPKAVFNIYIYGEKTVLGDPEPIN